MSDLTPKQELFLEYLFNDSECDGDTMQAVLKAGYERCDHARVVRSCKDEILNRTQEKLAMSAPKASNRLVRMMDEDGSVPKGELRLKAVESILDRVGVSKKQEMDVKVEGDSPIFFIPAKLEQTVEQTD